MANGMHREAEASSVDARDDETSFKMAHKRPLGTTELEFGVDYRSKKRDITYTNSRGKPRTKATGWSMNWTAASASVIEETRLDPYIMFSGANGAISWEAGLRYETTKSDISYIEDGEQQDAFSKDYNELLPSVHLRWDLTDADRISLSLAKSIKRPNFNELIPVLLDGEFGDNDYIGNPKLDPETANGIDLGFEHRLGKQGVVGVNFFYRDVEGPDRTGEHRRVERRRAGQLRG